MSRTVVKKPQILICTAYWIDGAGCAAAVGSGSGFEADWQAFLFGAQYLHSELFLSIPSFKSPAKKKRKKISLRTKANKKLHMVLPCIFDLSQFFSSKSFAKGQLNSE